MSLFYKLSEYINDNKNALALEVVDSVIQNIEMEIPEQEKEQALSMYINFFDFFGETLVQKEKFAVPAALVEWSKKNAEMQAASGGEISTIIVRYSPTRAVFNELLTRISLELGLSLTEHAHILNLINKVLDVSLNETVFAFERLSKKYKEETQKELIKLSAPIVPIKDDIAVLPLIGYFDENRTKYLTDKVLPEIADMGINHVIADFSGVLTIDALIADSLHQIGKSLRLMGINVVATGLRPELAQITIRSGINMSEISTYATVKQALMSIK